MTDDERYCFDLVRAHDKDRFLASLFAPEGRRNDLLALHAFNVEVARIADAVSEPQLGLIRQQWWLDTLDGLYGGEAQAHPVARRLADVVRRHGLPRQALHDLVRAREADLLPEPLADPEELEAYLGKTVAVPIQLAAIILAGPAAAGSAEAAGLAGVAYGLARLLASPLRSLLPSGMTVEAVREHARKRLAESRALRSTVSAAALPAFLPASLTETYLGKTGGMPSQFRRQLALWWSARRNRF